MENCKEADGVSDENRRLRDELDSAISERRRMCIELMRYAEDLTQFHRTQAREFAGAKHDLDEARATLALTAKALAGAEARAERLTGVLRDLSSAAQDAGNIVMWDDRPVWACPKDLEAQVDAALVATPSTALAEHDSKIRAGERASTIAEMVHWLRGEGIPMGLLINSELAEHDARLEAKVRAKTLEEAAQFIEAKPEDAGVKYLADQIRVITKRAMP